MLGNRLGRYEILELLGRGGQSIAYKARDPKIDRIVAIKQILSKQGLPDKERSDFLTRFMREAQAAGRLSHPNIATIYDVGGDEEGEPYIAMEYVDGSNLDELIARDHPLLQTRILRLFVQLCSALDYAHDLGVVHRDIKPGNIMVTRDDRVKVVDFGIAKMDSASMTQAGTVMGTPNYMSPEQVMGKSVDRRSDLFSLGVVLYEALTGVKPFAGEHWTTVSFKIVHERHASALNRKRDPVLLPEFDLILDRALAKSPNDRYQNCAELGRSLEQLLHSERLATGSELGSIATPVASANGDAPVPSSGATIRLKSGPALVSASGKHGDEPTAVSSTLPDISERGPTAPPPTEVLEPAMKSAGVSETSTEAEGSATPILASTPPSPNWSFTISRVGAPNTTPGPRTPPLSQPVPERPAESDALAVPPAEFAPVARRPRSSLLVAAALAVVIALGFVVVSRIPGGTTSAPSVAAAPLTTLPAPPASPAAAAAPSPVDELLHEAREALGQNLIVGRDGKDALHFASAALALDPDNPEARALELEIRARAMKRIATLNKQGRSGEVQRELDVLLEKFPGDAEARSSHDAAPPTSSRANAASALDRAKTAGDIAYAKADYAEAISQFSNVTRAAPRDASAFYFLGRSYLARNQLAEATKNLTRACELEPRNPTYNIQLSRVLEKNQNLVGAVTYLDRAIGLGGDGENSVAALTPHAAELRFHIDLRQLTPHTYQSKHVHRFGNRCDGQLVVAESGVSFIPDKGKEHAMRSAWDGVKRFAIVKNRLELELSGEKTQSFECAELDRLTAIAAVVSRRR